MDPDRRNRLLALVLASTALILLGVGAWEVASNLRPSWEAVPGEVVASEVVREDRPLAKEGREQITWRPEITYRYTTALGEQHTGDALHAGVQDALRFPMEQMARDYVDDYPVGAEVEVWYDPAEPEVSALEVGAGGGWILVGLGVLLLGGAGVLLVRAR